MSASTINIAPASALAISNVRCSGPKKKRITCGTTRPTKPIEPAMLTMVAVISAAVVKRIRRTRGGIVAEGERVQRPGIPQADRQTREHHHNDQLEFGPANAAEAAQQPEHHIARLLRAGGGADGIGRDGVK